MDSRDGNENDNQSAREAKDIRKAGEQGDKNHSQEKRFEQAADFNIRNSELAAERQKRTEIVEGMVSKDFPISPEKRLDNAKDFHYADTREFGNELERRDSAVTEKDKRLTQGFYDGRDNQAFVKDEGDTLKTSIHEKIHQKSMSELPTRMNEGVTEHLARREAGTLGELKKIDNHGKEIPIPPSDYEKEAETISKLSALVGDSNIHSAYFEGKTDQLRGAIDGVLGEGSFQKISEALEKKDYNAASDVIDKYHKK